MKNNLKRLRNEKGYKQLAMADELGMPQSTYQQYEAGINEPNLETLIKMADYFGVTLDYLVGRTNLREPLPPIDVEISHDLTYLKNASAKAAMLTLVREIRQEDD